MNNIAIIASLNFILRILMADAIYLGTNILKDIIQNQFTVTSVIFNSKKKMKKMTSKKNRTGQIRHNFESKRIRLFLKFCDTFKRLFC